MEFRIETNDEIKLLKLTVSGELSASDVDTLADRVKWYEGKDYKCILDISSMEMIGMSVAGHAVDVATNHMLDAFDGYCLVAGGSMFQLISMFAVKEFVYSHLSGSVDEAMKKLGL
jgi:hypothetical protein